MIRSASIIGGLLTLAIVTPAWPHDAKIDHPTMHNTSVDWCSTFAANCGAGGANLYCQKIGFAGASHWTTFKSNKTWVIGSDQYCTGDTCVGFSDVTCMTSAASASGPVSNKGSGPGPGANSGPGAGSGAGVGIVIGGGAGGGGSFDNPTLNGAVVDWCSTWSTNCGAGGANLFCQVAGFSGAANWTTFKPGKTWVIGSNQSCNGGFCIGFSHVTCTN
jgi:hypothetical protein